MLLWIDTTFFSRCYSEFKYLLLYFLYFLLIILYFNISHLYFGVYLPKCTQLSFCTFHNYKFLSVFWPINVYCNKLSWITCKTVRPCKKKLSALNFLCLSRKCFLLDRLTWKTVNKNTFFLKLKITSLETKYYALVPVFTYAHWLELYRAHENFKQDCVYGIQWSLEVISVNLLGEIQTIHMWTVRGKRIRVSNALALVPNI